MSTTIPNHSRDEPPRDWPRCPACGRLVVGRLAPCQHCGLPPRPAVEERTNERGTDARETV